MRWPFHFGNAARADGDASAPKPAAPPRRREWASLAPIQRAIGDAPLTAPSLEFSRSLAGSDEPPLHLETLGHHRTPDGPQGLVVGIANPIQSYAPTSELVGRPRRRSEAAVSVQAAPEGSQTTLATGAGSTDTFEDDSADRLSRVLPALTGGESSAPVAISRLTDASTVELGALLPVQRSIATPSAPFTEAGVAADSNQLPPPPSVGTRLNLGLSRRHGLGAPIRSADIASVQRSAAAPEAQSSPGETPPAEEPLTAAGSGVAGPMVQRAVDEVGRLEQWLPHLPIARRQGPVGRGEESESPISADATGRGPAAGDTHAQAAPTTAHGAVSTSIQRIVGTGQSRPGVQLPGPRPEQYRATPTVPLTSMRPSLTSVRTPGEPVLMRSLETFGEMPQPAVQRSPVIPSSPTGAASGAPARAIRTAEFNPLVWNVQRLTPGESPGEEPATGAPSAGEGPSPGSPLMAAAPAAVPSAGAAPTSGGGGVPQPGQAPAAAGGPGTGAPAAAAAAAPHGEKELHELAQALFHPLMTMLRREVLVERERAGFVTDLR